MKKKIIIYCIALISSSLKAQDFQYSQYFSAPLFLNPAFTGSSDKIRIGLNNRIQWNGLNKSFNANSAYVDIYSHEIQSGFGISANSFTEELINLRTQEISAFYSYRLMVGQNHSLRFGTQISYQTKSSEMGNLIHQDQIDAISQTISPISSDFIPDFETFSVASVSFGLLYTANNFWLGISNHHINNPQLWFVDDPIVNASFRKYSVHSGYQFLLSKSPFGSNTQNKFILVKGNYKQQGQFRQLDLNTQLTLGTVDFGLGFRGIPGIGNFQNRDSIILLLGMNIDTRYLIGYSYDWQISGLGENSGGVHEISLRLKFHTRQSRLNAMQNPALRCFYYLF